MIAAIIVAVGVAVGGLGVVTVRRRRLVITVEGNSMLPTYRDGDRLLIRTGSTCRPGDVVVFANPNGPEPGPSMLVKRVAAVTGDEVPQPTRTRIGEQRVGPRRIVVLGDAAHSLDSRIFGDVAVESVVGVVLRELGKRP